MKRWFQFERIALAVLLLWLAGFTWRGTLMFFSGDDAVNLYRAWTGSHIALLPQHFLVWIPAYRPLGAAVYLASYAAFGFHPAALYTFCWLLRLANALLAYKLFKRAAGTEYEGLIALSLIVVHGAFMELYDNAGTIYDQLWFTFTALGLALYARTRQSGEAIPLRRAIPLWACCVLAMDSKEGGVTLPVLYAAYECIYILPAAWKNNSLRSWLRTVGPLHAVLIATAVAFVLGRVYRSPEFVNTPDYHPDVSLAVGLSNLATYLKLLTYDGIPFTVASAGLAVAAMFAIAALLKNRTMLFGWVVFLVCLAPVLWIRPRPGYVLYVPSLGLGLYFGALLGSAIRFAAPEGRRRVLAMASFAALTALLAGWHVSNSPPFQDVKNSAHYRLATQFREEYPQLPPASKILFVTDEFARDVWDPVFLLKLLYHDRRLEVQRLEANIEQQPPQDRPWTFDYVFAHAGGRYEELDPRDIRESVRLHILRYYTVGRSVAFANRDHGAYVVSGIMDFESHEAGRWTRPQAKLKFETAQVASEFYAEFFVPEPVAAPPARTLSVLVNGTQVGAVSLTEDGAREVRFPVAASLITAGGFTIVDLNVDQPYRDDGGTDYGVVLMRAGFDYTQ